MRKTKRFLPILLLFVFIMMFFVGCKPKTMYWNYEELKAKVVKVEVVYAHYIDPYDVLEEMDESEIDEFLYDLSKIKYTYTWAISNKVEVMGISFCLHFNDGDKEVIGSNATTSEQAGCSEEEFDALVDKYYHGQWI